jgi:hypothetical protein
MPQLNPRHFKLSIICLILTFWSISEIIINLVLIFYNYIVSSTMSYQG